MPRNVFVAVTVARSRADFYFSQRLRQQKIARHVHFSACYTKQLFVQIVSQQNCETSCEKTSLQLQVGPFVGDRITFKKNCHPTHCFPYKLLWLCFSGTLKWKENLAQKAAAAFLRRQQDTTNLQKLVYGNGEITPILTSFILREFPEPSDATNSH